MASEVNELYQAVFDRKTITYQSVENRVNNKEEKMGFIINKQVLSSGALFLREKEAYSGVHKIAGKVMQDIQLVFGIAPTATEEISQCASPW